MPSDNLIFGCSTLNQHESITESLRILDQASDLGIVHFDTARAYGAGESELILARHLRGRRGEKIVTTKWGLQPPVTNPMVTRTYARAASVSMLSPVVQRLRSLRRAIRPTLFSPESIRSGLEQSLRALGTDYVDYFLLHEATIDQSRRRAVQGTLAQLVNEGKIRQFGIGSAYEKIAPGEALIPAAYAVLQFEHNPVAKGGLEVQRTGRTVFTHSALTAIPQVKALFARCPGAVSKLSTELDVEVASPHVLPGLLLAYSHAKNPAGKVIFSTRSSQRVVDNVTTFRTVCDWSDERSACLQEFLDRLSGERVP